MNQKHRTANTLFMLMSLDGKISTGETDDLDFDRDLPTISGIKEGLHQYYDIEKTTDIFSFNTGRVMAKIGVNTRETKPQKIGCTFVIVDNKPHLTARGIGYLTDWTRKLILVTTNSSHPAKAMSDIENLTIVEYQKEIDFKDLFVRLKNDFGARRVTIQSGGEMNCKLIREGLIDSISVVIAPAIIGGRNTSSLVDGESIQNKSELKYVKSLDLKSVTKLKNSYLHLKYKLR